MNKIIMERRSEAARMGGIKLKSPDFSSTTCLLMFYKLIYEYIKVHEALPLSNRAPWLLLEFMRTYSKATFFLIVEGGATAKGLSTVNSKHLGLYAQGTTFILEELPYISVRLAQTDPAFSASVQELTSCFSAHLSGTYGKLVEIITSRAHKKCEQAMTEAKWEIMMPPSQLDKDYYIIQMANDISSMLSILQTVLSSAQIQIVFSKIIKAVGDILTKLYSKVPVASYIPAQRVKNDIQQLVLILQDKLSTNLREYVEELQEDLSAIISVKCQPYLEPR